MYVSSPGAIISGRLHNLKTSVNGEDRPFGTIRDTEITCILSCDRRRRRWPGRWGGGAGGKGRKDRRIQPRNSREREARDRVLVEIIRRFETLGLPLSHDPNSNPPPHPVPASGLPGLSHARYNGFHRNPDPKHPAEVMDTQCWHTYTHPYIDV